jgi:hypothetical protein
VGEGGQRAHRVFLGAQMADDANPESPLHGRMP